MISSNRPRVGSKDSDVSKGYVRTYTVHSNAPESDDGRIRLFRYVSIFLILLTFLVLAALMLRPEDVQSTAAGHAGAIDDDSAERQGSIDETTIR